MAFNQQSTKSSLTSRAAELNELLSGAVPELLGFLRNADEERLNHISGHLNNSNKSSQSIMNPTSQSREQLHSLLLKTEFLDIQKDGTGSSGLHDIVRTVLQYSVNTSAPGFLDKLYAAPLPPGILAELVLSVLNTNVHIYQVSPVLTLIEKHVTTYLARMFGLEGPRSGGIIVQGGSASNMTSIVTARNTLFPETKRGGNSAVKGALVLFTSTHGHYSIEMAAQAIGLGSNSVVEVPVDDQGLMIPAELERLIIQAKQLGSVPFYVNATAGTTVLGSFDPFDAIASVAKSHRLWFHIDAAWGGGFVFSKRKEVRERLHGSELADSIAMNPHKMLGIPVTCSFLLANDLRQFHAANTLRAGYLFHDDDGNDPSNESSEEIESGDSFGVVNGWSEHLHKGSAWEEPYDLADMTLQCGRRGDSLKFFFSLQYYGTDGYCDMVDNAYAVACHASRVVEENSELQLVLPRKTSPSCLQVCFYFTPGGKFAYGLVDEPGNLDCPSLLNATANVGSREELRAQLGKLNSRITSSISKALISKGFMVDFAPALDGQEDRGSFFRVVVNISTVAETMESLLSELVGVGHSVVTEAACSPKRAGGGPLKHLDPEHSIETMEPSRETAVNQMLEGHPSFSVQSIMFSAR